MTDTTNSASFGKKRLIAYASRGQVYSWLRAHHDEVAAKLAAEEITWPALTVEMARQGVVGRWDKPPTANAALRVWRRVREDVRDKRADDHAAASSCIPTGRRLPLSHPERLATAGRTPGLRRRRPIGCLGAARGRSAPAAPRRRQYCPVTVPLRDSRQLFHEHVLSLPRRYILRDYGSNTQDVGSNGGA
jgi:hypothetical protein